MILEVKTHFICNTTTNEQTFKFLDAWFSEYPEIVFHCTNINSIGSEIGKQVGELLTDEDVDVRKKGIAVLSKFMLEN